MGYGADVLAKGLPSGGAYYQMLKALCNQHFRVPAPDPEAYWRRVAAMTPGERAFLLTNEMLGEVCNGGFEQYFLNTGYMRAHETVRALILIGATKKAELLLRAVQIARIPDPLPPDYEYFVECEEPEACTAALNQIDREFYKDKESITDLMVDYLKKHPEEFA